MSFPTVSQLKYDFNNWFITHRVDLYTYLLLEQNTWFQIYSYVRILQIKQNN